VDGEIVGLSLTAVKLSEKFIVSNLLMRLLTEFFDLGVDVYPLLANSFKSLSSSAESESDMLASLLWIESDGSELLLSIGTVGTFTLIGTL